MTEQPNGSAMETMKAVRIHAYGGPEVLVYEDAPRPNPAPGELLIRVHAAGVNPVDWKVRQGYLKHINYPLPLIPGWDLSGVVETTGPGVANFQKGDCVYSRPDIARDGAYAEYIVVREGEIALKPDSIEHIQAAAIPLAALAAWQSLFGAAQLRPRQSVLIHAAAGGVGSLAVQLAKWKGAHVIGTASGRNQDYLRELGADTTVNYEKTRFEDVVRNVDVVFDAIGGDTERRSWKVLKKDGILVSIIGQPSAEEAARRSCLCSRMLRSWRRLQGSSIPGNSGPLSKPFFPCRKRAVPTSLSRQDTRAAKSFSVLSDYHRFCSTCFGMLSFGTD